MGDFLRYLVGDRRAILNLAADRRTVPIGLLFVLSAAFAREYDGEDLLHEPWYLALPLAASLVSSFILFLIAFGATPWRDTQLSGFWSAYRSFLGLFWLTAPMAWLYAVPYERFLPPEGAMKANLTTLAVVSAWRVFLMMRVITVLTGHSGLLSRAAFFRVMLFADMVMVPASVVSLSMTALSPIVVMGGVRMQPADEILAYTSMTIVMIGMCTFLVWLLCAIGTRHPTPHQWAWAATPAEGEPPRSRRGLIALALASVLVWSAVLPFTQLEQQRRQHAERLARDQQIAEMLDYLSAHSPEDFPPGWDPPPRLVALRESFQPLMDTMEVVVEQPTASWVRAIYIEKLHLYLETLFNQYFFHALMGSTGEESTRLIRLLERMPEGRGLAREFAPRIESEKHLAEHENDRAALEAILKLAGEEGDDSRERKSDEKSGRN